MNKGIDNKVIDAISSYTFCVIVSSDDAGIKKYMNALATMPKANAIGMPENMTISVTAPYKVPKVNGLMRSPLFYSDRFFFNKAVMTCNTICNDNSVMPNAIMAYGIHSGGAKVDEVVWPSTQAS